MSTKDRQLKRQRLRDERMKAEEEAGKAVRVVSEPRKKKQSLPNRVNTNGSVAKQKNEG